MKLQFFIETSVFIIGFTLLVQLAQAMVIVQAVAK